MHMFPSGQRDLCFIIDITISLWDYLSRERIYLFQEDSGQMHDRCEIDDILNQSLLQMLLKTENKQHNSLNRLC